MIEIICGGKKHSGWVLEGIFEYEKRLRKPFDVRWEILEEDKLNKYLEKWPFSGHEYIIVADERGENISSPELSEKLNRAFLESKEVVIIIGGAFGVSEDVRRRADFVWSFSRLVFPHMISRLIVAEQVYRAQEIANGGKYHHE